MVSYGGDILDLYLVSLFSFVPHHFRHSNPGRFQTLMDELIFPILDDDHLALTALVPPVPGNHLLQ